MKPYADTNLFTRLYLELPDTAVADRLVEQARKGASELLPVTWLHGIELTNAFQLSEWLGRQGGHPRVSAQQVAAALAMFREDVEEERFLRRVRLDLPELEHQFEELALRHTAKHGFRTYDLLHVAAARLLGCDTFWSFDARAQKLAKLEGLGGSS